MSLNSLTCQKRPLRVENVRSSADEWHGDGSEQGADGEAGLGTTFEVVVRVFELEVAASQRTTKREASVGADIATTARTANLRHVAARLTVRALIPTRCRIAVGVWPGDIAELCSDAVDEHDDKEQGSGVFHRFKK